MIIDLNYKDIPVILSFSKGYVGWDYDDIDLKDSTLNDLVSMKNQMNNASLDIDRELRRRGK